MLAHRCCVMVYNRSRSSDQACKAGEDEGSMLARAVAQIPELTVATESSKTRAFPCRSSRLPDEHLAFVPRNNFYPNYPARLQGVQPVGRFQTFWSHHAGNLEMHRWYRCICTCRPLRVTDLSLDVSFSQRREMDTRFSLITVKL